MPTEMRLVMWQVENKTRENEELTKICDELMSDLEKAKAT
jgi:hypothetical protein